MKVTSRNQFLTALILGLGLIIGGGWGSLAIAGDSVEVTVKAKQGFKFEPSKVEVPAGAKVKLNFENTGVMAHNLKVPELDAGTDTIGADKSESITFTAGKSGSYQFICDIPGHKEAGMKGSINVQ